MKAIVTGMIATYPLGGVAWDYGQYVLGMRRLGFEVVREAEHIALRPASSGHAQ